MPEDQVSPTTPQVNALKTAMSDFLSPKPVVGAGACSAMVLAFTASLCSAFPILPGAIVALLLSGVFAVLMVTTNNGQKPIVKCLYGLICTLMIFSAARGGNVTANEATPDAVATPPATTIRVGEVSAGWSLIPNAMAAETNSVDTYYFVHMTNGLPVYTNALGQAYTNLDYKAKEPKFFKGWKWK